MDQTARVDIMKLHLRACKGVQLQLNNTLQCIRPILVAFVPSFLKYPVSDSTILINYIFLRQINLLIQTTVDGHLTKAHPSDPGHPD